MNPAPDLFVSAKTAEVPHAGRVSEPESSARRRLRRSDDRCYSSGDIGQGGTRVAASMQQPSKRSPGGDGPAERVR
jgi:hypothetical protein